MDPSQLPQAVINIGSPIHTLDKIQIDTEYIEQVIYRDHIPEFVTATLIRLYDNVFCTLHRIAAYETLRGISTYVRRINSIIQTVILFRDEGKTISVVNQQVNLKQEEIDAFAKKIFAEYKSAQLISFYALDAEISHLDYRFQKLAVLEENIIYFPLTPEEYLNSIKGQFRKQLRVSKEQMLLDCPGFQIKMISKKEIKVDHIQAILGFARERMKLKGKSDYTHHVNIPALMDMLIKCGHMAIAVIDDKICGGAIWFSVGRRHFHQLAAHDATYDRYMLGNQIWLAAILQSLNLGGSECWLMGGASAHKARFGAQKRMFHSYILYRSSWHIFLNPSKYTSIWFKDWIGRKKLTIKDMSTRSGPGGRCIKTCLLLVNMVQTSMQHFMSGD